MDPEQTQVRRAGLLLFAYPVSLTAKSPSELKHWRLVLWPLLRRENYRAIFVGS
jgi:hypothetical protein